MEEVEADRHEQAVMEPGGLGGEFTVGSRDGGPQSSCVVLRPEPHGLGVRGVQLAYDPQRPGEYGRDARLLGLGEALSGGVHPEPHQLGGHLQQFLPVEHRRLAAEGDETGHELLAVGRGGERGRGRRDEPADEGVDD